MRQRKSFERIEGTRSSRLVVIASEGRYTESIYFNEAKSRLSAGNVKVEVLKRDSNESSPESVYRQIAGYRKEYDIADDDELWLVVDRDRWDEGMLSRIAKYCQQEKHLSFCLSNPCFELWLLLHLEDVREMDEETLEKLEKNPKVTKELTWLKQRLRQRLGSYSESNYDAGRLLRDVEKAMTIAKELDVNPADRWPQSVGTRVYLLMQSIMDRK